MMKPDASFTADSMISAAQRSSRVARSGITSENDGMSVPPIFSELTGNCDPSAHANPPVTAASFPFPVTKVEIKKVHARSREASSEPYIAMRPEGNTLTAAHPAFRPEDIPAVSGRLVFPTSISFASAGSDDTSFTQSSEIVTDRPSSTSAFLTDTATSVSRPVAFIGRITAYPSSPMPDGAASV